MFRQNLTLLLLTAFCFILKPSTSHAQNEKVQRIQASYMMAFGRPADGGEVNFWNGQPDQSIAQRLAGHRQYANNNEGFKRALISKSYIDGLGRSPKEAEIQYFLTRQDLYYTLMQTHVGWLAANPAEYEKVIRRSYQAVFNRTPSSAEINYWKNQGTLSYIVLIGCHEQWKRTNGNTEKTSGGASIGGGGGSLQTVPISSNIASEVKNLSSISVGGNVITAGGGNVITIGGGNVITAGGANVITIGGAN